MLSGMPNVLEYPVKVHGRYHPGKRNPIDKALKPIWIQDIELISRVAPSVEAHHHSVSPDAGKIFGGRWIIKK